MLTIIDTFADVLRIATFQGDPHVFTGRPGVASPRHPETPQRTHVHRRMRIG